MNHNRNQLPANSRRHRAGRVMAIVLLVGVLTGVFVIATPRPASAQVASVTTTIKDIPRTIADFVGKAVTRVKDAIKVATDIAFKNSLQLFNARVAQTILTQISTAGPGQKPLFLTNPTTFFRNVVNSSTADFIDQFSRGLTGRRGPGAPLSSARQRFLISQILRTSAGDPLAQCRQDCQTSFGITGVDTSIVQNMSDTEFAQLSKSSFSNEHAYNIVAVSRDIVKYTQPAVDTKTPSMTCRDVYVPPDIPPPGQTYVPWRISVGVCNGAGAPSFCTTTAQDCLNRQQQAINTERSLAQGELNSCLKDVCQNGVAGATTNVINSVTNAFAAGQTSQAIFQTPATIANSLRRDTSDFGKLLQTSATLSAVLQQTVTGEQTKLSSGVLPRTSKVSGVVLVPREANQQSLLGALTGGTQAQQVYTGTSAADVIKGLAAFINSPVGRLLASYFQTKCGLNPDACRGPSQPTSALGELLFGNGGPTGVAGAKLQFSTFEQVQFLTGDPGRNEVDIPETLTSSGLVDAQFRTAIEDQLTLKEALDKHLIDPQKAFGFDQNGGQATNGYSYRALQYLRKFRVTPVGWELAANYSQQFDPRPLSLGFLTKQYNLCGQDNDHKVCNSADPSTYLQACTTNADCGGGTCGASPYCGLVDPNWVLKAPQTYCRRQGAGEEILTKEFVCDQNNVDRTTGDAIDATNPPATDRNAPNCTSSQSNQFPDVGHWVISRNTDTCADTQSCIAENDDGTCIAYGYCAQERQRFKFDGTQCPAQFASCTTYTDSSGQQASYLANTLDNRNCNSDVAGCQWYCQNFDAANNRWACSDTSGDADKINFTDNVQSCSQSQVGCRQFIRTTAGSNLLKNSGFESFSGADLDSGLAALFDGWATTGGAQMKPVTSDDTAISTGNSAAVSISGGSADTVSQSVDSGFALYERTFVGSIRAKAANSCTAQLQLKTDAAAPTANMAVTSSWQTFTVSLRVPAQGQVTSASNAIGLVFQIGGCGGAGLTIDSAQLEEGTGATQYKDYGSLNNIYLNGTRQQCTAEDVGCETYTRVSDRQTVNAITRDSNRCSADKVGCAAFTLEPITSVPTRPGGTANIVAPQGQQCSAAYVGCEEYTNLDQVAKGGEGKEYYTAVRQCVQPKAGDPNQTTFYTWVGDATRGFVLRAYDLLKSNQGGAPCTSVTFGTSAGGTPTCNDTAATVAAASCTANDLATNPDCAEYYDSALQVYYRLRSHTVSVTTDCHPYRNTVDQTDTDASNDNRVYFLSPSENTSCPEQFAGCRAYTGNASKTTKQIFTDTFENGTVSNWVGGLPSTQSVNLGGHSMSIPAGSSAYTTTTLLQNQLVTGKSYLVSFIAAASTSSTATITASFGSGSGSSFTQSAGQVFSGTAAAKWNTNITPPGPEWQSFTLGPLAVTTAPGSSLGLTTSGGGAFVDNVTLTEINDSVYLISNTVPLCSAAEVGCEAYRDRAGVTNYVTSFTRLCSQEVVGCEALIDTQNSASPFAQTVKNETTPADTVVTFVNNRNAYCSATAKGCSALGQPVYTSDHLISDFKTVYLKNDPDRYSQDLCLNQELFCKAFTTADGTSSFFKDPANQTCEYRTDATGTGQWFVTGTNFRCPEVDVNTPGRPVGASCSPVCLGGDRQGRACLTDADCPGSSCPKNAPAAGRLASGLVGQCTSDADCAGGNKCIYQVGICPEEQNSCNEYRDPSDPVSCRSECRLVLQGGSPVYVDQNCVKTQCSGSNAQTAGQNCQTSDQCTTDNNGDGDKIDAGEQGQCIGMNNQPSLGFPGCRPYFYLKTTIEDTSADCNGQIDTAAGCRPFNDTSRPDLNYRGL